MAPPLTTQYEKALAASASSSGTTPQPPAPAQSEAGCAANIHQQGAAAAAAVTNLVPAGVKPQSPLGGPVGTGPPTAATARQATRSDDGVAPRMRNCKKPLAPTKKVPVIGVGDRLSSLPNNAIRHILGFLPAREAVQTCVLAWFWCDLWKSATGLYITCGYENEPANVKELKEFVDCLLQSRGDSPLETCDICLLDFDDDDIPLVNNWIHHAVKLNVQVLCLCIYREPGANHDQSWFELDNLPLVSQHLTTLELRSLAFNDNFLDFSSCPVLQDLRIVFCDFMPSKRIISRSLKRLCIDSCEFHSTSRNQICTPNLVSLCLLGSYNRTPLLERMPSLLEAVVQIDPGYDICEEGYCGGCRNVCCYNCYGADGDDTNNCVLLSGLSDAVSLALIPDTRTFIIRRDLKWCPIFSNLKSLLLNEYWCRPTDCSALACILEHSPVLQKLTLELFSEGPRHDIEMKGTHNPMTAAISKHLEIIELKCEVIDKTILKVLKFLSALNICFNLHEAQILE